MTVSSTPNSSGRSVLEVQTLVQILSDAFLTVSVTQIQSELKPDAKEERNHSKSAHISQRSFLYGEWICVFFFFFLTNKQQSQQEGTHGDEKQKRRKIMRLDEGMVTHGEECDSCGLKMSEIYLPIGAPK